MKVYSIGREAGCDIVINDSTDVISRRHAILNVTPMGKMTIVDQSHNGTYVNGIRISPNVPVPVTRKDNISFAHVARLDWNRVPKSGQAIKYSIIGVAALVVIAIAGFGISAALGGGSGSAEQKEKPAAAADTTGVKKDADKQKEETTEKKEETTKQKDDKKAKQSDRKDSKNSKKDDKKAGKKEQKNDSKAADTKKTESKPAEPQKEKTAEKSAGYRI